MWKFRQRILHERYGISFSTEEAASAKSLLSGLPHLESSYNKVLPSGKRLGHFFTVEKANAVVL
jgi:hypothetical protein